MVALTSFKKGATPCGSIILTHREAEFHNLPPCGSKIRDKPEKKRLSREAKVLVRGIWEGCQRRISMVCWAKT